MNGGSYKPRFAAKRVQDSLADTPVVVVVGPRQAGKSTMIRALVEASDEPWTYLTLDDIDTLDRARTDPMGLIAAHAGPVAIDEVQRAPDLLLAIKASVDRDRRAGRFLLTGSADVFAVPRVADALTGRVETVQLRPFSQGELAGEREDFANWAFSGRSVPTRPMGMADLARRIASGGFAPALERATSERRYAWFDAYLTTSLQRDARDVADIRRWQDLPRLARLVAARTAQTYNHAELARTSGLPGTSLARYLQVLKTLFLLDEIPAWSRNPSKRVARRPKLLVSDTGLASALLGLSEDRWADPVTVDRSGPLVESFVGLELLKQSMWSDTPFSVHHYREHSGSEVDFVLEARDGRVVGIEVKASQRLGGTSVRGLERLRDDLGDAFVRGVVLHGGEQGMQLGDRLCTLPIAALWAPDLMA